MRPWVPLALLVLASVPLMPAHGEAQVTRERQPVVLLGALLPELAAEATYVERPPLPMQEEQMDGWALGGPGWPVDRIAAWSWDGASLRQVTLQVDERFPRYLTNYASGFGVYSQADWEWTYAFDAEGKRKQCEAPGDALHATFCTPERATPDPVKGLDSDDEVVLLWGDMGARMPDKGALVEVAAKDPLTGETRYAYLEGTNAPVAQPRTYVTYARDEDADLYVAANHGSYGGAPGGACYPGNGVDEPLGEPTLCSGRRPKDSATVTTERYQFHYSGRWTMDGLTVNGVNVLDRWKGRAFQQREGNAADVGGYEDERDWSRSSVTLGEKAGPIRVLRETWGADSGTSVTRLDAFYPESFVQTYHLRVHPIPPDGLYAFWDHKAGTVDTYYTALRPQGVPIDGRNDELYGTNSEWQQDLLGQPYFTIDAPDPTLSGLAANEMWDQVSGAAASMVTYIHTPTVAPGALTPYYRDDLAFDDGTGHDPAPQGSWGAHGIHFFFTSDTDNAFLPAPVDEFVASTTQHVFGGRMPNVGEQVAAMERAPLVAFRP